MKKILIKSLILAGTVLPIVGCTKAKAKKQADLFFAYSTENLMGDWNYLDNSEDYQEENAPYLNRDHTLRFSCMRGENEGTQLIIHANKYINNFDFTLPSVTNGSKTIDASNFTVAAEWYLDVSGTNERQAYSGLYPDALIPLENYKFRRQNHIEKDRNQGLYINFLSTEDMELGNYKGTGTLTLDGEQYSVPFEVTIYDALMPEAVHQNSCYLIWYEQIANGELDNDSPEMHKKYYDFTVSKRISPDELPPSYMSSPETFADSVYKYVANNDKVTNIRFPIIAGGYTTEKVRDYLTALIDYNLELRAQGDNTTDLFKKVMFYIDDEPSREKYDQVKGHDKEIYDIKKSLASRLNDYPELKQSFMKIMNLVTIQYSDGLAATEDEGGVQCWCPQYQHFNTPAEREVYRQRQASTDRECGENVWWYGCTDPQSPYSSQHLDANLMTLRSRRYMQFDYQIEGDLFWNMCYYSKFKNNFTYSRDIWTDPISWGKCAGDGQFVYPGVTYGINGPITTLRLENLLASNEEYEYLWLIEQKVNEYNELKHTSLDVRELLSKHFARLYKNVIPYLDNVALEEVRTTLLTINEKLYQDLESGIELLRK